MRAEARDCDSGDREVNQIRKSEHIDSFLMSQRVIRMVLRSAIKFPDTYKKHNIFRTWKHDKKTDKNNVRYILGFCLVLYILLTKTEHSRFCPVEHKTWQK